MCLRLHRCTNSNLTSPTTHLCFIMGCAWQHRYVTWYCSLSQALHYPIYAFLWQVSIQSSVISWLWAVWALGCCLHLIEAEWNGSIYQRRLNQGVCMWEREGESVCVCVCVCVCRQTALGDQSAQLLAASNSVSLSVSHTHSCFSLHVQAQSFDRSNILVWKEYNHTVYQPVSASSPPLCWLQTSWSHISSVTQQAGRLAGRQADRQESGSRFLSFKCRFTSYLRQELRCLFRMRSA